MSTKLYNGYKIKDLTVWELKDFTDELKKRLETVFSLEYKNYFGHLATSLIDETITWDYLCGKSGEMKKLEDFFVSTYKNGYNKCWILKDFLDGKNNVNIENALEHIQLQYFGCVGSIANETIQSRNFILETKGIRSALDFQNEIVFFSGQSKTLFLAYGHIFTSLLDRILSSKSKKDRDFRKKYGFEYYGYWNNTDKPENISQKKWNERGIEWNDVLMPDYIPSKHGLCCELVSMDAFFNDRELVFEIDENMPLPSERAKNMAVAIIRKNWMDAEERKEMDALDLMEQFNELNEEHAFDEEIAVLQTDLEKLLPIINTKALRTRLIDFAPNYKKVKGIS